jgi:hypothetical protein
VSEPAARCPAPSALAVEASAAVCAADELTAGTSRQPRPMEGGAAYAAVVAGRAVPRQESGSIKPTAKGSGTPEPAAPSEADFRRTSLGDVSGLLSGMPAGTTPNTPMGDHHGNSHRRAAQQDSYLSFRGHGYPWILGMVEGVMPQRSLSPEEGRETYAGSKDGRWLPSDGKYAAVPGWEQGSEFSHVFSPGGPMRPSVAKESRQTHA